MNVDVIVELCLYSKWNIFPDGRLDIFCDSLESFCGASCSLNMLMRWCKVVLRVVSGLKFSYIYEDRNMYRC